MTLAQWYQELREAVASPPKSDDARCGVCGAVCGKIKLVNGQITLYGLMTARSLCDRCAEKAKAKREEDRE